MEDLPEVKDKRDDPSWYMRSVFPPNGTITLISGQGRETVLNIHTMREVYKEAVEKCPRAADAIACLIWSEALAENRAEHFLKQLQDLEAKVAEGKEE